jgi:hypothetical protein
MTAATDALWLQLPLDERFGASLHDASPARRNAVAAGELTIFDDEQRGPCLELSGGTLTLPALDPASFAAGFTLVVWAKPAADGVAVRFGSAGNNLAFASVVPESGAGEVVAVLTNNVAPRIEHRVASSDEWCLFALAMAPAGTITVLSPSPHAYPSSDPSPPLWQLLFGVADSDAPQAIVLGSPEFRGRLSQLRIYADVLSVADLDALRAADLIAARRALGALPISMSLEDDDAAPVLLIDARNEGHTMTLRVGNSSRAPVHLALPDPDTDPENDWHFTLAFRPGTLTRLERIQVVSPGWTLTTIPGGTQPTIVEDRLLLRTADAPVLPLAVVLSGLVADPAQGTRTTRIQLQYQNLQSAAAREQLRGTRTHQLTLINHQGQRQMPVHVGLVGARSLTLGVAGELRLHIANALPETGANQLRFGDRSSIQLSFDEGSDCDWTLAGAEQVQQIRVHYARTRASSDTPAVTPVDPDDSKSSRWILPLAGFAPLAPREHIELLLTNIQADGASGPTNIYIDLVNIPGYWDQRFQCTLEKLAPVAPQAPLTWRPLALQNGWQPDPASAPELARDAHGLVHLRGACWRDGWALFDRTSPHALALPNDGLPARPLQIPGRASVWPRAEGDPPGPIAHSDCHLMRDGQASVQVDVLLTKLPWNANNIVTTPGTIYADRWAVVLHLDGISYLADSPVDPTPPPDPPIPEQTPTPRHEGPAGPAEGFPFDDSEAALALDRPITRLIVRCGEILDAIQTFIADTELPQHGGDGGGAHTIDLEPGDVLTEISGYTGDWHGRIYVLQITLRTRDGREYGPFGDMSGAGDPSPFHFAADPGQHIAAFHGAIAAGEQADGSMSAFVTGIGVVLQTLRAP